jgi:hypothetical protein
MRVVVPYTNLRPGVVESIQDQGYTPECLDTSRDVYAYFDAIKSIWEDGESFIVVEHDIVAPPGSLDSMTTCSKPWCALPYETPMGMTLALGCTKFEMVRDNPKFFESLDRSRCNWSVFDGYIAHGLRQLGYVMDSHPYTARHAKHFQLSVGMQEADDFVIYSVDVARSMEDIPQRTNADATVLLDQNQPLSVDAIRDLLTLGVGEGMRLL